MKPRYLSWGSRCDIVAIAPERARRCTLKIIHDRKIRWIDPTPCQFGDDGEGVCMQRSTNMTTERTRYCSLTADHDGKHIYLEITERDATTVEMRRPEQDVISK